MIKVPKAFGFGPVICQWIQTFYNKIKSTVIVNGHTSLCFFFFFLLKEDVVKAIQCCLICFCYVWKFLYMIRENRLIKGININDEEHSIRILPNLRF